MTMDGQVPIGADADAESDAESDGGSRVVDLAVVLGGLACVIGLVAGVGMAIGREVVPCPDGTFFSSTASDRNCYAHPDAGAGIGIAALSVALGALLVLGHAALGLLRGDDQNG